jgi:hypothetical protein
MSGANPVENKPAAANVGAAPAASALAEPAAKPAAKPRPWTLLRRKQKLWLLACGMGVAAAGATYGYKYFVPNPGTAVAQSDLAAVSPPPSKPSEADKVPPIVSPDDVPPVVVPPVVKPVNNDEPVIKRPDSDRPKLLSEWEDADTPPIKVRVPDEIKKDKDKDKNKGKETDDSPPLILPPNPGKPADTKKDDDDTPAIDVPPLPDVTKKKKDEKKPAEPDPFKATDLLGSAPEPLPTEVTEKKDKSAAPIIRIRADDPAKKEKDEKPTVPMLDLDLPPVPPAPPGKSDEPAAVRPPVKEPVKPTTVKPPISDDTPPTITSPMIPDTPPIKVPGQDTPPPPPTVGRTKPEERKDSYDEDWHTKRDGDTYASISQEYLHDVKYAKALEAYNRDRRRGDEKYVFVPPTWVLKERFPNMVEESDRPEVKPAGNVRFEPVAPISPTSPTSPTSRPAPTPAGGNDEYKVTAEAGESIRDIARKVYGSEDAWKRLWTLNDSLDPTRPIPNGTTLRIGR